MAHAAKLGALTDELVTLLTSFTTKSEPARFSIHRESALRAFRYSNYPRTNQFDVDSQLEGLQEKFRVYNKDSIADALQDRREIISELELKWTPEILHLLLELSNRPVVNSKLEDLDFLKEPEADSGPPLQWEDLIAEDPLLRDKHIWRNVDFGADSSDEDGFDDSRSELSDDVTIESSVDGEFNRGPEAYAVQTDNVEGLKSLRKSQFWRKTPSIGGVKLETVKQPITELQAIREVLFMLAGLPTSLFETPKVQTTVVEPSKGYTMKHVSYDAFYKTIQSLAGQGSALAVLRSWARRPQSVPLLQILQNSIVKRVAGFDAVLSTIQHRFVSPSHDIVVSLLSIQAEVSQHLRTLIRLSYIVERLDAEKYSHTFRYLELLHEETCTSQMAGDGEMFVFMGTMFFDCFQVFLRPLRTWMEDGEINQDDKTFFVSESTSKFEAASVWKSQYKLRQTQNGVLHAPKFLNATANKIFTAGKSVVVLKQLNQLSLAQQPGTRFIEPPLNFGSVCNSTALQLAPFSELFDLAFSSWIRSKFNRSSLVLRRILFDNCGLHVALDALETLYFMADGAISSVFTKSVFDKLDTLDPSWNDRFTLTELAQSSFGSHTRISSENLRVKLLTLPRSHQGVAKCRRSIKVLSAIEIAYRLSWPIQIIVEPDSVKSYQKVFTFLFQIRRSQHILSRSRLVKDMLTHTSGSSERALYYSLRARLLWFSQSLYHYLAAMVLEPCSQKLREDLRGSEDVDSMIRVHSKFIKSVTDQALLGSRLGLIHKTIINILDIGIKLEDAQAANSLASQQALEEQQDMMDRSIASLGLHTPQRPARRSFQPSRSGVDSAQVSDSSSEEDENGMSVDLSLISSTWDGGTDEALYGEKLRAMKADFDRLVRFVASGLKGVARAGGGEEARSWDLLGEMLEAGLSTGVMKYQ